ncbi:hypothetical protein LPW36_16735 [Jinshanibacter sp. LJY008]|uniref:Uncharacterized protein n=1 Tax=Limnobaculum eriocheiris TaxID=2897391 RepID=A0A9X1SLZ4_9GAMM|nr:hypothetical protein [Limnobaculum eriocheiris]MCD1127611.1 hypothetical protein [Limnobaculum eriocheiris]
MAGLPLLMFIIFPAALAMLIRFFSRLAGKPVQFLPIFLSLVIISFSLSVAYVMYHYGFHHPN